MNYKHIFHAGNFADIFKHLALITCLEKIQEKNRNFFVIDTHAGAGKYDLESQDSLKTLEAKNGILSFFQKQNLKNPALKNYLKILAKINIWKEAIWQANDGSASMADKGRIEKIKFYPGSPYIIKYFLRPLDKAMFCEIKNEQFLELKRQFSGNKKTRIFREDGFDFLAKKVEIKTIHGLVLIDPAYEKASNSLSLDYERVVLSLKESMPKIKHAIYLIWHPIINKENDQRHLQRFYLQIREAAKDKVLHFILNNDKNADISKMNSCGLFVINASSEIANDLKNKLSSVFKENLIIK